MKMDHKKITLTGFVHIIYFGKVINVCQKNSGLHNCNKEFAASFESIKPNQALCQQHSK